MSPSYLAVAAARLSQSMDVVEEEDEKRQKRKTGKIQNTFVVIGFNCVEKWWKWCTSVPLNDVHDN